MKRMALFPPQPSKQNDNANTGVFNLPPQPRAVTPNNTMVSNTTVSYTHLRAHETSLHLVCRLLLEKKKKKKK